MDRSRPGIGIPFRFAKLSWKGQILGNNLHPMALEYPDFIFINVFLDPSHFIGATNVHDLFVGGQFN